MRPAEGWQVCNYQCSELTVLTQEHTGFAGVKVEGSFHAAWCLTENYMAIAYPSLVSPSNGGASPTSAFFVFEMSCSFQNQVVIELFGFVPVLVLVSGTQMVVERPLREQYGGRVFQRCFDNVKPQKFVSSSPLPRQAISAKTLRRPWAVFCGSGKFWDFGSSFTP